MFCASIGRLNVEGIHKVRNINDLRRFLRWRRSFGTLAANGLVIKALIGRNGNARNHNGKQNTFSIDSPTNSKYRSTK